MKMTTTMIVLVLASPLVLVPALLAWASASGRLSRWMWRRTGRQEQEYADKPYGLSERDWGRVWEVELPRPAKNRISSAIYRGEGVQEPSEAAIAAEGARRAARSLRRVMPVWAGQAVVQVAGGLAGLAVSDLLLALTFLALGAFSSGVVVFCYVMLRRARIAERVNAEVAGRAGVPPAAKGPPILLY